MRWFTILFFCVNLLLSSYYIDTWQNGNTTSRALPVVTWNEEGTFRIDKYHEQTGDKAFIDGHYYSEKPPLPTIVAIPFFKLLVELNFIIPDEKGSLHGKQVYLLGGFLAGSLPFALIISFSFLAIRKLESGISPVILAMMPYFGSYLYVFSGTFFAHLFSGMLLLAAYIYLKKEKYFLSGLFAGLCFLSEFNLAVIIFVWGVVILLKSKNIRFVINYTAGIFPAIIFILIYNYIFTGSPFDFLYKYCEFEEQTHSYGFSFPSFQSLWGLSFSWYRGIFFYAPFLLLFLFTLPKVLSKGLMSDSFKIYVLIPGIIYFVFISSFFAWSGGWSFGPRLFIAMAILFIYEGIQFLQFQKLSKLFFWVVIIFGLIVNFLAKVTIVYSASTEINNPFFNLVLPNFINGDMHNNNIYSLIFGGPPIISFGIFILLFSMSVFILTKWHRKLMAGYNTLT